MSFWLTIALKHAQLPRKRSPMSAENHEPDSHWPE